MKLFFVILTFIFVLHSAAEEKILDLSMPNKQIGNALSVYEDKSGKLDFAQIEQLPADIFIPLDHAVDGHLFTSSAFWYRFEVKNSENVPVERLIVVEIPWINSIDITVLQNNVLLTTMSGGNNYPYYQRAVEDHFPNFKHSFIPGVSTVYIKVMTQDPFIVPISIVDRETFLLDKAEASSYTGFIYGFLVSILLYNLFLYFSIKTRYYALYVLYVGSFILANMAYNGFTFKLFFADYPQLQNWAQSTTIFLFSICGLLFAQSFLNLKEHSPSLNRTTQLFILFFVVMMLLTAIAGYHYHVMFSIGLSVVFSFYVLGIAIYSLLIGNRSAKFFLLGTMSSLIGTSITALTVMALVPYTDIGFKALDYGMVMDAILLSLALADRVRITNEEKAIAQREAKTDMLTGLLNRRAYYEICTAEIQLAHDYGTDLSVIMFDIDYFKNINDEYGHAAGDKVLQYLAVVLKHELRETDYVFRIGGEEFLILMPYTKIADAVLFASRIRAEVDDVQINVGENEVVFTVSGGVAEYKIEDGKYIHAIERRADEALYRAKWAGRNNISI